MVELWHVVHSFTILGWVLLENSIILMSCLTLSIVLLILLFGRVREVQNFGPNPRRRRVPWGIGFSRQRSWRAMLVGRDRYSAEVMAPMYIVLLVFHRGRLSSAQ